MPATLSTRRRSLVLAAAFLAWMFAGLEISLFILVHRQAMSGMLVGAGSAALTETVVTQWFAWFQVAFLCGAAAGGWLFGSLGDRIGRTRSLALSVLCYSLATGACWFVNSPEAMLALRLLGCLGIGGSWPNAVALVSEAWPDASRPLLAGLLGTAANVGFVLLGVIALVRPITPDDWRWVFLVGASPAALGAAIWLFVPESPRWLATRRAAGPSEPTPLAELFRRPLVTRTLLGIGLGSVPVIGTAANANWVVPWRDQHAASVAAERATTPSPQPSPKGTGSTAPDYRAKARTQITRSSGAALGSLVGGLLANLLGRRLMYFLISLLCLGASTYLFGVLDPSHPHFEAATFLLGLVGVTYFGWLPLYLPELFPTHVRATGTGISFNSGRLVAAAVVLAVGLLAGRAAGSYAQIGLWTGMIYAAGMIVILLAPRTTSQHLPD